MINIFSSLRDMCQRNESKKRKGVISKSILHAKNSRCQLDLIDMQAQANCGHKLPAGMHKLVYQDRLTKFVLMQALQTKRAEEAAFQLMNIFLTFGVPCTLHSDNGTEIFSNSVTKELTTL